MNRYKFFSCSLVFEKTNIPDLFLLDRFFLKSMKQNEQSMQVELLKAKIHGIKVTEANVAYRGSLTMDEMLMDAADMLEYEKVLVVNNTNGERLETYLIRGAKDSGVCCLNGAAAYKGKEGDELIVMAFTRMSTAAAQVYKPKRVFIKHGNKIDHIQPD